MKVLITRLKPVEEEVTIKSGTIIEFVSEIGVTTKLLVLSRNSGAQWYSVMIESELSKAELPIVTCEYASPEQMLRVQEQAYGTIKSVHKAKIIEEETE